MTRIILHIGLPGSGLERLQSLMQRNRDPLARAGVLYPEAGGGGAAHTRLYMAASDPEAVDLLRATRGLVSEAQQARAGRNLVAAVAEEAALCVPDTIVFSSAHLVNLHTQNALLRLRGLLAPLSQDIRILAHVDDPAKALLRHYEEAVMTGRTEGLDQELALAEPGADWRARALARWREFDPEKHLFPDIQAPPFWLDYTGLQGSWEAVFGAGSVQFRPYGTCLSEPGDLAREAQAAFDLPFLPDTSGVEPASAPQSAETLARARALNQRLAELARNGQAVPRRLWRRLLGELVCEGEAVRPGALAPVSKFFRPGEKALIGAHPALDAAALRPERARKLWCEPETGFDADAHFEAILPAILGKGAGKASPTAFSSPDPAGEKTNATRKGDELSQTGEALLSDLAKENFLKLRGTRFAPHNRIGPANEAEPGADYPEVAREKLRGGSTGKVIVACMKDEAPYILEWVAYHRAIGVDNFLIYTNGCSDGTDEILGRLMALGIVEHRNNDDWKGNSPQQYALNRSLKERLIRKAEWVIHIDVDEFINVRVGDGTLDAFLAKVPDASNVAMTWRLFGHNGVRALKDDLVIAQFDHAAPKYCPKPHTVWGFKTMVRNIGAYGKLSCHRPNKLVADQRDRVVWVNGSGQRMSENYKDKGWRSDVKNIGYDMLQLNHYALRSAESYLIKRQRGRALHVDRSIGLNYWIRMDWSDHKDVTIQRNIPRVLGELGRLMADEELARLHKEGFANHQQKAAELHANPEFQALYEQALETRLTGLERAAFSLALDLES